MKVSVVPAQITTVEDRIAGNLNFTQILLLSAPLFISAVWYVIIPPIGHLSVLKFVLTLLLICCFSALALRIKDKILLDLIKLRLLYIVRPHIFVFQKTLAVNSLELQTSLYSPKDLKDRQVRRPEISKPAKSRGYRLLKSGSYSVLFKAKSGGLSVEVTNHK